MAAHRQPRTRDVDEPDEGYFDLKALSVYSHLSVRTLRNYLTHSTNPIPHYRLLGKILVKRTEFEAWLSTFRVERGNVVKTIVDELMGALR
jgi:hypothetical protein